LNAPAQSSLFDRYGLPVKHVEPSPSPVSPASTPLAPRQSKRRKRAPFAGTHAKHEMHANSLAAYREVAERLSKRCAEILEIYRRLGQATDREILQASEYGDMDAVRPRITELIESGWLEEIENVRDGVSGRMVRRVRISNGAAPRHPVRPGTVPPASQDAVVAASGSASAPELSIEDRKLLAQAREKYPFASRENLMEAVAEMRTRNCHDDPPGEAQNRTSEACS
jgi:hypothetical protein